MAMNWTAKRLPQTDTPRDIIIREEPRLTAMEAARDRYTAQTWRPWHAEQHTPQANTQQVYSQNPLKVW